tara:strand:- start:10968 stop:12140 length:1173 start_codon:yes stop_codon:yes gene_type:complete
MKKKVSILGSTGSIGLNSLRIFEKKKNLFSIYLLSANKNFKLICNQIKKFDPKIFIIKDFKTFKKVKVKFKKKNIIFFNNINECKFNLDKSTITIAAISGIEGLLPTIELIKKSQKVLIANKESIICGWNLIKKTAKKYNTRIVPIDSEHFSIMKLLEHENKKDIKKIYLTASGGPFLKYNLSKLNKVKPIEALNHPKWKMGKKISIDSASLMNKMLEIIEAHKLFSFSLKNIEIVIHPESLVHAIVQFKNGLYKFLYHETTMLIPLTNAIFEESFDIKKLLKKSELKDEFFFKNLSFQKVDKKRFPVIKLKSRMNEFYSTPIIINAANEILVDQFLKKKIPFNSFYKHILNVMRDRNYEKYAIKVPQNINQIMAIDKWAREVTFKKILT